MALTAQQETDLLALLAAAGNAKRAYELSLAPSNSSLRDYSIIVDESSLVEAQRKTIGDLLNTQTLDYQGSTTDDKSAVTPEAFLKTTSTVGRHGVLKIAFDSDAVTASNSEKALTPSNLDPVFDARFKKTKTYVTGDFDDAVSNYDSITVLNLSECVVGDLTFLQGHLRIVIDSSVLNIEAVLNATKTPLHLMSFSASLLSDLNRRLPIGCESVTSSGKLKMVLGKFDNTNWESGTYEIVISLTYLSA